MRIYKIIEGSPSTNGFAWASGYGPLPDMPFLVDSIERRKRFWELNPSPMGAKIDPGGYKWPDFMGCGHSPPMYFVSKRVLDAFRSQGIEPLSATPMPIGINKSKKLRDIPPPDYFVLRGVPGAEWDFTASGVPVDTHGKAILNPYPKNWPPPVHIKLSTWTGHQLFALSNFQEGQYTNLFCTENVVKLAEKEKWTNVRFDPVAMS